MNKMKTKFTSPNGKWEIRTAPGHAAAHWIRIIENSRKGYKDIEFDTIEEFIIQDPSRLDHGKSKTVPKSIAAAAAYVAVDLLLETLEARGK